MIEQFNFQVDVFVFLFLSSSSLVYIEIRSWFENSLCVHKTSLPYGKTCDYISTHEQAWEAELKSTQKNHAFKI